MWSGRRARAPVECGVEGDRGVDDDPAIFWSHVLLSLARAHVDLNGLATPMRVERSTSSLAERLAAYLLDLPQPVVLVLDNADSVSTPEIWTGLNALIRTAGERMRVVLCARADPALPLHRYRQEGLLTEIRTDQLAFTAREAGELFGDMHTTVSPHTAAALCRQTRGSAVALRLAGAAVRSGVDPEALVTDLAADDGGAIQHLVEEVLAAQPAGVRKFLLEISVTTELWPSLVSRLGGGDAEQILVFLARVGAFVERAPAAPGGYRIPDLLREMLLAQLSYELPGEFAALHGLCAAWYADASRPLDALAHAIAATPGISNVFGRQN